MISVFELFKVGIGPSSSHTVGPMRAADRFVGWLSDRDLLSATAGVQVELFGSLGATGQGHGSVTAVILGLLGEQPESVDPESIPDRLAAVRAQGKLALGGRQSVPFAVDEDIVLHVGTSLAHHSNGMLFRASDAAGDVLATRQYFSVGGGFVVDEDEITSAAISTDRAVPYPFRTSHELLDLTAGTGLPVSALMLANESELRPAPQVREELLAIWEVMQQCVNRGLVHGGVLPGGLRVRRRAAAWHHELETHPDARDPLEAMDWVALYALAVNEENAAGGRVVTAPTNGAAGIVPAVLHYCRDFVPDFDDDAVVRFLLTAGAVGILCKTNASISGAEVGCQGEVGSACAMAAAGLAEVLGGTPAQVENAAEIGLEHNLGLTCDPVGGLVQIPCIERNAVASVKAITAARMALRGDGIHHVDLDTAIKTMRDTGADMAEKYKETSLGGLALNVVEC
ncbi:serine ammonia-lyase [Mycobacterium sp. Root265]|uniref:L-serine ammonia-lyase n=1 Tax=Mycobacterium sp. Root265 TaxID=1736504 RepID=UPI0007095E75|nr:L-serine ammonia-lyase [Mycobacterium sp. Root265]KRD13004.1 serine ammonia-lyase [Mycobacterium sp. Root265]